MGLGSATSRYCTSADGAARILVVRPVGGVTGQVVNPVIVESQIRLLMVYQQAHVKVGGNVIPASLMIEIIGCYEKCIQNALK